MKPLFLIILLIAYNPLAFGDIIKCKGIIDVKTGKILKNKFLHIEKNKIKYISSRAPSPATKIIDLSNRYILPGLIDSHSHLFFTQTAEDKTFGNAILREARLSDQLRTDRAKFFLKQYLMEGFTTIFDLGNSGFFLDAKLKSEIKNNSQFPTLLVSGPGIATEYAQFDPNAPVDLVQKEYSIVNVNSNFDKLLKLYIDYHVDILKIYLDNSPGHGEIDEGVLRKIISSKHARHFKKITFHTLSSNGAQLIKKFNLENIEHFSYFNLSHNLDSVRYVAPSMLSKETLMLFNSYYPAEFIALKNSAHTLASQKKIKILFGPDFYFHKNSKEFNRAIFVKNTINALVNSGLSPLQLIQSMTINPALSMHLEDQIGQIKPGAYANLIATKENPLEKISTLNNISFIMNQGEIIRNN